MVGEGNSGAKGFAALGVVPFLKSILIAIGPVCPLLKAAAACLYAAIWTQANASTRRLQRAAHLWGQGEAAAAWAWEGGCSLACQQQKAHLHPSERRSHVH